MHLDGIAIVKLDFQELACRVDDARDYAYAEAIACKVLCQPTAH